MTLKNVSNVVWYMCTISRISRQWLIIIIAEIKQNKNILYTGCCLYRIISLACLQIYCQSLRLRPLLCVLFHMCGQILCNPYVYIYIHNVPGIVSFQYLRKATYVNTVGRTWHKASNLPWGKRKCPIWNLLFS